MSLSDALFLDPAPFEVWFSVRTDGAGSGTLNDPYAAANFDAIMSDLSGPMLVHLGPGEFETSGYSDDASSGWQIRERMRIVGAGMGVTTLKLVTTYAADVHYYAIGHPLATGTPTVPNPVDCCEVSDLTVDCNMTPGIPAAACGGIRLMGNHVKIARVRFINWGTTSATQPCFVAAVITGDRTVANVDYSNAGIEDCVAELPYENGMAESVTVFHAGGKESAGANAEAFGRGPYIRRCFVDCGSLGSSALTTDIRALSMGWCRAGVVEQNQVHNTKIGGPYQDKASTREIVVRNNSYKNVMRGPWWKLGIIDGVLQRELAALTRVSSDPPTAEATLANHGFQVGDRVEIDGTGSEPEDAYKGVFSVKDVDANTFQYVMDSDPGSATLTEPNAQKVFGTGNILIERNIIELATGNAEDKIAIHVDDGASGASEATPAYVHTEAVIRENRIRYVDGEYDATWDGEAIRVCGTMNALVRDNLIECGQGDDAHPLKHFRCGTAQYFNNKTPRGALIQGYDGITNQQSSELETEAEDALLMTLR